MNHTGDRPREPQFLGIGAQKAGTTWLYEKLKQHPQISFGVTREIDFFSTRNSFYVKQKVDNYERGIQWYLEQLDLAPASCNGEFSVNYMWDLCCAGRIHQHFPNVKLIVSIRNPVDRAYSQYLAASQVLHLGSTFRGAINDYPELLERGLYYKQLKPFYELFPSDQIRLVRFEDIVSAPRKVLEDLAEFLEISPHIPADVNTPSNASRPMRYPGISKALTRLQRLADTPLGSRLWSWPIFARVKNQLLKQAMPILLKNERPAPLDPKIRAEIQPYFREDIQRLEELTGLDLSDWCAHVAAENFNCDSKAVAAQ